MPGMKISDVGRFKVLLCLTVVLLCLPALGEERTCLTMEEHQRLLLEDPLYFQNRQQIEDFTKWYVDNLKQTAAGMRAGVIKIPVVVHVVWNTSTENISDAQIKSQIKVLNEDYRRLNSDASKVPTEFKSVAADTRIEFQLAVRDPDCNTTTGITRTKTTVTSFTKPKKNDVKYTSKGGHDAWPRDKYLNLWVCDLASPLLGFAQFPGGPAATDGVVIDYAYFGNTGTATSPYDLGRTATHEVGHWLNLYHTFRAGENAKGEELTGCKGTTSKTCAKEGDEVCDTSPTGQVNTGCPSYPQNTCTETPKDSNDQTINYMDYVNDACMYMYTAGQAARMDAALHGPRSAILGSDGLIPPPSEKKDLWMQDTPADTGKEPNPSTDAMYRSDDIFVRHNNDGKSINEHQNPVYKTSGSNYVYVRVRNRGCNQTETGTLKLYWAKASTALGWPSPWDGSVTTPALMGGKVGEIPVSVPAGGFKIVEFTWPVPNPADYASFGADKSHFCLLARIETSTTSPYGMTYTEGSNLDTNVRNNNNIVWKNVTVTEKTQGGAKTGSVTVGSISADATEAKFVFEAPTEDEERSIFNYGTVLVNLGPDVFNKWQNGGAFGNGIQIVHADTIQILTDGAWIGGVEFHQDELYTIQVEFHPYEPIPTENNIFFLDVSQYDTHGFADEFLGGQRFIIKSVPGEGVYPGLVGVDIGGSQPAGSVLPSPICWDITAGGADIWGTADQFFYAYASWPAGAIDPMPVSGNFTAVVAWKSRQPMPTAHEWAKAGIMIRQNLEPGSPHVMVVGTPANGVAMQGRDTPNGESWNIPLGGDYGPSDTVWLRLDRVGNTFTGSYAIGGETPPEVWIGSGSHEFPFPDGLIPGLATTSHEQGVPIEVTYTDLYIGPYLGPSVLAEPELPGAPAGGHGYMGIREVIDNGEIRDQDACYGSLGSGIGTIVDYAMPVLNIHDSDGYGNYGNDNVFGVVTAGHRDHGTVDDISLIARGAIQIPAGQSGPWTFGFNSDDGCTLQLPGHDFISATNGEIVNFEGGAALRFYGGRGAADTLGVINLPEGNHPFWLTYHEGVGGAAVEFFAARGVHTTFDPSVFKLVGHTSIGTVPVPGFCDEVIMAATLPGVWGQIDSIQDAMEAVAEGEAHGTNSIRGCVVVNHSDPEDGAADPDASGSFGADQVFPNDRPGDDDDFAVMVEGLLDIPAAGVYQIGFNSDDGAGIQIFGQRWHGIVPGSDASAVITGDTDDWLITDAVTGWSWTAGEIEFEAPGCYEFRAIMFERGGGSFFEMFGRGVSPTTGRPDPTWHLLEMGGARMIRDSGGLQLVGPSTAECFPDC
ncbi:MAG: hypothetical protein JSU70_08300, partial [Phycisphaerales bacterium]